MTTANCQKRKQNNEMGNINSNTSLVEQPLDTLDIYATDTDRLVDHQINAQLQNEKSNSQSSRDKDVKILFLGLQDSDRILTIQKIKQVINTTNKNKRQQQQQDQEVEEIVDAKVVEEEEEEYNANKEFREIVHFHTLNGFQQLLQGVTLLELDAKSLFNPKLSREEKERLYQYMDYLRSMNFSYGMLVFNSHVVAMIEELWAQPGIQSVYNQRNDPKVAHFQSLQCLEYFMNHLTRITTDPYIPSDEDVQFCTQNLNEDRSGIETVKWMAGGQTYTIFHVKGKYNDCRKWLFQFEGVDVVCFLCPLGDYDLPPDKVGRENVLKESLNLFDRMCNSEWFRKTPVMLLMTKFEVFREKINDTDLICCFRDYSAGCVYQSAVQFVTQKFLNVRKKKKDSGFELEGHVAEDDPASGIYPIYTCSDDSIEELVNNIRGTLKNIQYMQQVEKRKRQAKLNAERKEPPKKILTSFGSFKRSRSPSNPESPNETTSPSPKARTGSFFSKLSNMAKKSLPNSV